MGDVIDELGKYVPMEPRRSYPVVIVTPERIAALEAEVERLREALKFAYCALGDLGYAYRGHAEYDAMDRIKAALEPQKGAGDE